MAKNYSQRLPRDRDDGVMEQSLPPFPANAQNTRENAGSSSVWSLNPNTTAVLVAAIGAPVAIKWAGNQAVSVLATGAASNYDATLTASSTRLFVVPRSVMGIASNVGLNISEGLYPAIATQSLGVGSVLLTEY